MSILNSSFLFLLFVGWHLVLQVVLGRDYIHSFLLAFRANYKLAKGMFHLVRGKDDSRLVAPAVLGRMPLFKENPIF